MSKADWKRRWRAARLARQDLPFESGTDAEPTPFTEWLAMPLFLLIKREEKPSMGTLTVRRRADQRRRYRRRTMHKPPTVRMKKPSKTETNENMVNILVRISTRRMLQDLATAQNVTFDQLLRRMSRLATVVLANVEDAPESTHTPSTKCGSTSKKGIR